MQKNTVMFVVFSTLFLMSWYLFFQPKPTEQFIQQTNKSENQNITTQSNKEVKLNIEKQETEQLFNVNQVKEEEITIESDNYKVIFSNKGASIKNWFIKEKNGSLVDLVLPEASPILGNFPGSVYEIKEQTKDKIVFAYTSNQNWKIIKTFNLSQKNLHKLDIELAKLKEDAKLPEIELNWGPGLGTDNKELKENISVTRILGYTSSMPAKLEKIKTENNPAQLYKWIAIDNRYFLAAFMPS
ncbi:MAG: hypothetical protein PHH62_04175, partial [Endomicrobiaceae bacterium]|nr:hypothetical protein [Endomicrobiaceae bacterium]